MTPKNVRNYVLRKRTAADWVLLLAPIPDSHEKDMVARIIWWDFLASSTLASGHIEGFDEFLTREGFIPGGPDEPALAKIGDEETQTSYDERRAAYDERQRIRNIPRRKFAKAIADILVELGWDRETAEKRLNADLRFGEVADDPEYVEAI
jgi:hypothetical protein